MWATPDPLCCLHSFLWSLSSTFYVLLFFECRDRRVAPRRENSSLLWQNCTIVSLIKQKLELCYRLHEQISHERSMPCIFIVFIESIFFIHHKCMCKHCEKTLYGTVSQLHIACNDTISDHNLGCDRRIAHWFVQSLFAASGLGIGSGPALI